MHLCTLGGFCWGMSGILAIVSVISRLGRGVCGSRTCCRPEIPLLRRSCVCRRWRVWERRQLERLAQQSTLDIAERFNQQVRLEFVQIRHAPQERGPASAVRRHLGLWGDSRGRFSALPKSSMRYRDPTAQTSRTELGRSNIGWLLIGYGGVDTSVSRSGHATSQPGRDLHWISQMSLPSRPPGARHQYTKTMPFTQRPMPKDLVVGGRYLHVNRLFIRQIDAFEVDTVIYHDQYGPGRCSRRAFLKACPALVSPEEATRAEQELVEIVPPTEGQFTLRDEANALTAFAFRNGYLEDLHAGKSSPTLDDPGYSRISDAEMKRLMIEASEKLEQMLRMKQEMPAGYEDFIRHYQRRYCRAWKR